MKIITLKFPAICADEHCGKALAAGTQAKWYGRGRVYGIGCHEKPLTRVVNRMLANGSPRFVEQLDRFDDGRAEDGTYSDNFRRGL